MSQASRLNITVDHTRCVGSTMCVQFCPKVFALNEKHQAIVVDPDADTLDVVRESALGCPMMAIEIKDAETGDILFP